MALTAAGLPLVVAAYRGGGNEVVGVVSAGRDVRLDGAGSKRRIWMMRTDVDEEDPRFVLVRTKLLVPASRAGLVSRPRLVELLAGGVGAKMTLVYAPMGWEKTSVLAEWATSSPNVRFAWVSLA